MPNTFFPPLTDIVPVESLPSELGFIRTGLTTIFNRIYYKNLQFDVNARGDAAFYKLDIVSLERLDIEIFGTGTFIVLNPSHDTASTDISDFPITLSYEWPILGYLRSFNLTSFSFLPSDFFDLALAVLNVSERELIDRALSIFIASPTPINTFVDDINAQFGTSIHYPVSGDPIGEVLDAIDAATSIDNAGAAIFVIYILDSAGDGQTENRLKEFFYSFFGGDIKAYLRKLITPKINATISTSIAIEFPRNILTPIDSTSGEPLNDPNIKTMLLFDIGDLYYSTDRGIGFDKELSVTLTHSNQIGNTLTYPSQIGNTGLAISLDLAKLDLSRTENIPEADADGRPADFVGVYINSVNISLPKKWFPNQTSTTDIYGKKLLIGTGGISGLIGLRAPFSTDIGSGGLVIGFTSFDITFRQNTITQSNIQGWLKIPGFKDANGNDAKIDIKIHIGTDGEFSITASEAQGIDVIEIPGILKVRLKSLTVGRKDDKFYIAVSGLLDFLDQGGNFIKDNLPKDIEVQKLIIHESGKIEFHGGGLKLRKPFTLKIGPVNLSITGLHIGSHEQYHDGHVRNYGVIGFDGSVSVKPGGFEGTGKGVKFYFTKDDEATGLSKHVFIRIQSISIDLIIPGDAKPDKATLLLKGYLAMREPEDPNEPGAGTEYAGGIDITLNKLKLSASARMRFNPSVPSFLIDLGIELPKPIPVGPTGTGIYAIRALFGLRYVATKAAVGLTDEDKWYQYYKAKVADEYRVGIQPGKFEQKKGFSVGAGVSFATSTDSGKIFSAKVFLLLSLPDVFLLEGQGQILKNRIGLNDPADPPFYAFIAITNQSVETALGVNYKLQEDGATAGQIVTVDGLIELAFFFGNSAGWYVNLGRDLPEEKRIRARIFDLIDCYFYLMLSSSGMKAGAGASFKLDKNIGPFGVYLRAYMDIAGKISKQPKQIGGSINAGAEIKLKIFGFKFGFSANIALAAETPEPYIITGKVELCVRVFRKERCVDVELTWVRNPSPNKAPLAIMDPTLSAKAINILTKEPYDLLYLGSSLPSNPSGWTVDPVPVDSYIDFEFLKPVNAQGTSAKFLGANNGSDNMALVPPQKGKTAQVVHEFFVNAINIKCFENGSWKDYHIYKAMTAFDLTLFPQLSGIDLSSFKNGAWQLDDPERLTKLRVLSQNPLSYIADGGNLPESFNITSGTLFCEDHKRNKICVNIRALGELAGPQYALMPVRQWIHSEGVMLYLDSNAIDPGKLVQRNYAGFNYALCLEENDQLSVRFNEPVNCVTLRLETQAAFVRLRFFQWKDTGQIDINQIPIYDYIPLGAEKIVPYTALNQTVGYDDPDQTIDKLIIRQGECVARPNPVTPYPDLIHATLASLVALFPRNLWMKPQKLVLNKQVRQKLGDLVETDLVKDLFEGGKVSYIPNVDWKAKECAFILRKGQDVIMSATLHLPNISTFSFEQVHEIMPVKMTSETAFSADLMVADGKLGSVVQVKGHFTPEDVLSLAIRQPRQIVSGKLLCDLLPANRDLLRFLDKLTEQRVFENLTATTLPKSVYNGYLWGTSLYNGPITVMNLNFQLTSENILNIHLFGDALGQGYRCDIVLEAIEGNIDFRRLVDFSNLRPDPAYLTTGSNVHFLVDGIVLSGGATSSVIRRIIPLKGYACYNLANCVEVQCKTYLYQLCYLTQSDYAFNQSIPPQSSINADNLAMVEALNKTVQPIWGPNRHFAIEIKGKDRVSWNGSVVSDVDQIHVFGFRTAGGIGFFHNYWDGTAFVNHPKYTALAAKNDADAFRLSNLNHYIDYPKCFPNADGLITNAKPLYYLNPELRLFFTKQYVFAMFSPWADDNGTILSKYELEATVLDPADDLPIRLGATWLRFEFPVIDHSVQTLNNMIVNGAPCSQVNDITTFGICPVFLLPQLEPLKTYTAVFNGLFYQDPANILPANTHRREVHKYVFVTSEFGDFAEHIYSCQLLKDNTGQVIKMAVYDINGKSQPPSNFDSIYVPLAGSILNETLPDTDMLVRDYALPYDRVLSGALRLNAPPPAVTTEFNVLRANGNNQILGIWLRSPEPFNDPKMPDSELADTVELSINGGSFLLKYLFSKDNANVFISNTDGSMNLPAGNYKFTFRFKLFDGQAYAPVQTINDVEFQII